MKTMNPDKKREPRYHGEFTVGQAAAFAFATPNTIMHLFRAGRIPGAYVGDDGQPIIPIPGMKEAMAKNHVTLTRDGRKLTARLFHGVTEMPEHNTEEVFETTAAVEEYIGMFSKCNEGPTKVVKGDE